jgi:hypothetical protein
VVQSGSLVCAKQDETVSIISQDGDLQDCECLKTLDSAGDSHLQATCRDYFATNPPNGDDTVGDGDDGGIDGDDEVDVNDVCTLELDGTSQTFQNGESFGTALRTRCIDALEYPCFCDTSLPTRIRCPYCGYPTVTGELVCAELNETIQFTGAANKATECTCLDDSSSSSICRDLTEPTPQPTVTIPVTAMPTNAPTISPTTPEPSTPSPTEPTTATPRPSISRAPSMAPFPTTPWPTAGIDKPSIFKPNRNPVAEPTSPKPSPDGCFFNLKSDNALGFVENGRAFGEDVVGPCPHEDFPVICNTRLTGKLEYPYCVFSSYLQQENMTTKPDSSNSGQRPMSTVTMCAASGSRVLLSREDGSRELCGCLYNNPAIGPVSQCKMFDFNYTEVMPTPSPSLAPITASEKPSDDSPTSSSSSLQCGLSVMLAFISLSIFLIDYKEL